MEYTLLKECSDKIRMSDEMKNKIAVACMDNSPVSEKRKIYRLIKAGPALAAVCVFMMLTIPVMAAGYSSFADLLYRFFPETAQNFAPVQLSCEDNGIKMEVVSAYINDNTAQIFIAVTDLIGGRIDSTVDLYDSYDINTHYDSSAHCQKISFDENTDTATFMIEIVADSAEKLNRENIAFSVKQLMTGKKFFEDKLNINTADISHNPQTVLKEKRGVASADKNIFDKLIKEEKALMLVAQDKTVQPVDGVTITAAGYVADAGYIGENLHIQVRYDNIRQTDNHGYVYLMHSQTGNIIKPQASVSAFAEDGISSYEEYIFTDIRPQYVRRYDLYGWFVTCDTMITGNWKVNFQIN